MSSATETQNERVSGKVKWFNNKAGYGFITVTQNGEDKDIFVHYSTIMVTSSQYKYLVQGEYVEFEITTTAKGKHEFQATNVTGIKSGELMCETRRNSRVDESGNVKQFTRTKPQTETPSLVENGVDEGEFTTVVKRKPDSRAKSATAKPATAKPATGKPAGAKSATGKPATGKPATATKTILKRPDQNTPVAN